MVQECIFVGKGVISLGKEILFIHYNLILSMTAIVEGNKRTTSYNLALGDKSFGLLGFVCQQQNIPNIDVEEIAVSGNCIRVDQIPLTDIMMFHNAE